MSSHGPVGLPGDGRVLSLTPAPRLSKDQTTVSTSGWEGICLAWSFRELGLGLTSCGQITGLRLSKGWWDSHFPGAAGQRGQVPSPPPRSHQPVLCGAKRVHVGGAGRGDAATDGAEPPAHAAHEDRHPVLDYVPPPGGLRHEHPVPAHHEAGNPPRPPWSPRQGTAAGCAANRLEAEPQAFPAGLAPVPRERSCRDTLYHAGQTAETVQPSRGHCVRWRQGGE